ncbi:MAG: DUF6249 domain-containing protein [candidate division Zixibacteria bacterium]
MQNPEIIIVPVVFGVVAYMIKLWLDYLLKSKLINRGMVDEKVKFLNFNGHERYAPTSLKWGLVFVLVGISLLVIQAFPGYVETEFIFGMMLIAAGAGLLIYYFVASSLRKKHLESHPEQKTE